MSISPDHFTPERLRAYKGKVYRTDTMHPAPDGVPRCCFYITDEDGTPFLCAVDGMDMEQLHQIMHTGSNVEFTGWAIPERQHCIIVRHIGTCTPAPMRADTRTARATSASRLITLGLAALKSVKILKVLLFVASLGAYAWMYTWTFAVALIAALSIHEYGHVVAMRRAGIPTRGFYLIPFVGGVAVGDAAFKTKSEHFYVAVMGPVFGLLSIPIIGGALWMFTDFPTALGINGIVAAVNLFNLLPIRPLDGGRMLTAALLSLSRWAGLAFMGLAIAGGAALFHLTGGATFGVLLIIAGFDLIFEIRKPSPEAAMSSRAAMGAFAAWLALVAAFGGVVAAGHLDPKSSAAITVLSGESPHAKPAGKGPTGYPD